MRVLFVINSLILAGAEALTKDLALVFHRRGIATTVAVLKPLNNAFEDRLRQEGVPLMGLAAAGMYSPRHVRALRRVLPGFDVVQSLLFPASLWVAMAARPLRARPALVLSEGTTMNRRRRIAGGRLLDAWMYRQYDAIPCASPAIQQSLAQWIPAIAGRTSMVPNAVDLAHFEQAVPADRRQLAGDPDVPVVMFAARFEERKDHATLLRALAQVPRARLLLAGEGPLRQECEKLSRELGIAERVRFLGQRDDIPALLKAADVYVQCSNFEGFGIAAVEAMAAGLPVIGSDVPGLAELVRGAGLLFPAGDHEALARQIGALLESAERRRQVAECCRRRAQQFSIETCAQGYLETYERLLRQPT